MSRPPFRDCALEASNGGRDAPKLRPTFARVKEHRVLRPISARSVERDGSPHMLVHRGDLHAVLVARGSSGMRFGSAGVNVVCSG
jgi:hypothetical protein